MSVLISKRYKTYRTGHAPGVGLGRGCAGAYFFNMVMWHITLMGMMSRTECKKNHHPGIKLVTFGEVKRSNIINCNYNVNFKDFYTKLCMCIKDMNIHSVAWVVPRDGTWGLLEVQNLSLGVYDGSPSTAHSSYFIIVSFYFFLVRDQARHFVELRA